MPSEGYIYIMRMNENNNMIKVGYSKNPIERRRQLYRTGNPTPLSIYHLWFVSDMRLAEKAAHICLKMHRVNNKREFFEIADALNFTELERSCYDST